MFRRMGACSFLVVPQHNRVSVFNTALCLLVLFMAGSALLQSFNYAVHSGVYRPGLSERTLAQPPLAAPSTERTTHADE